MIEAADPFFLDNQIPSVDFLFLLGYLTPPPPNVMVLFLLEFVCPQAGLLTLYLLYIFLKK